MQDENEEKIIKKKKKVYLRDIGLRCIIMPVLSKILPAYFQVVFLMQEP